VDELLSRTSTDIAPWTILAANDKYYARVQALTAYRDALKKALKQSIKKVKSPEALKLG
jgi:polyphosphate kinase 2 (PPK2 family)